MRSRFVACFEAIINPWDAQEKIEALTDEFKKLNSTPNTKAFMHALIRDGVQVVQVYAIEPDHSLH
jgi:hypothetical protein